VSEESENSIYSLLPQIVSILESPERLLIIVNCGQGRQFIPRRAEFARAAITRVLSGLDIAEQPMVRAVCMSNSFPRIGHDGLRMSVNFDWRIWREAREGFPFSFGDYGATHRIARGPFVPLDIKSSVVLPLDESWLIYRHENANDPSGWIAGAQAVVAHEAFADAPDIWGTHLIQQAAGGNISDIDAPRFWYASKVNLHLHRQLGFARSSIAGYGGADDDEPPEL
jgi:hypothetical protein